MRSMPPEQELKMLEMLKDLQETFPNTLVGFLTFAQTVINTLIPGKPNMNRVQADICAWLFGGPQYRMIQAQRGQSKTILSAIFAVFTLIHSPDHRILIVSQKSKRAKEISGWCSKLFKSLDFLNFMLPDKSNGDRDSIEAFDVHWVFKTGTDKSPSITCESIESGIQGARADLILADDIESLQNSRTPAGRELLEEYSKEFETVNVKGDIVYLGTPQSIESIYNNLELRGYAIRIWPGRYPSDKEIEGYGGCLAPMIQQDMEDNKSLQTGYGIDGGAGAPTCPEMFDDELLTKKEISIGPAKFKLQYMLNTQLSDEERFPLKLRDLIVASYSALEGPEMPIWASGKEQRVYGLPKFGTRHYDRFYGPITREHKWSKFTRKVMYIDPAGGGKNGDETAYAILGLLGSFVYILDWNGFPGGYQRDSLMRLVEAAERFSCKEVFIEKNMGNGAHCAALAPLFEKHWPVTIEERWESGQKELRIIDVIEPIIASHRLVISPDVVRQDRASLSGYPTEKQIRYSGCFQLGHITRDKDCLAHDDRLDALAGGIRELVELIQFDMESKITKRDQEEMKRFLDAHRTIAARRDFVRPDAPSGPPKRNVMARVGRRKRSRNMLKKLR